MQQKKPVGIIVAMAANGLIGNSSSERGLPWHLPEDFKDFQRKTKNGGIIIMGRNTADLLVRQGIFPLKGRFNIVLSKNKDWGDRIVSGKEAFCVCHSLYSAMETAEQKEGSMIWIIGGAQIYDLAIQSIVIDAFSVTFVHGDFKGDAFFPVLEFSASNYKKVLSETYEKDERHSADFSIDYYKRKTPHSL